MTLLLSPAVVAPMSKEELTAYVKDRFIQYLTELEPSDVEERAPEMEMDWD